MDAGYYKRLAEIESNLDPLARNNKSTAKGLFQFVDGTGAQYGLDKYEFGTPEYTRAEYDAVQKFTQDNAAQLSKALGRDLTQGEMYLAHQQGAGGAAKLLSNPEAKAVDVVGADAVKNNRGTEDMTAQDFANLWVNKFEQKEQSAPNNFDDYTDEELAEIAGVSLEQSFDDYSDEELAQIAGIELNPDDTWGERAQGFMTGAADSITFGAGDEMRALLQGLIRGGLDPNVTVGEAYDYFLGNYRDKQKERQEDTPVSYGAGQVGGAFVPAAGAVKGAQALSKTLPAVGKLAKYARTKPYRAAAGVGAVSGGLYGFGSGEGGAEERLKNAAYTGSASAVLAPAGARGAQIIGDAVKPAVSPLLSRAQKILNKPAARITSAIDDVQDVALRDTAKDLRTVSKSPDQVFTMTKGQRTQQPKAQRLEGEALAGIYGDEAEKVARTTLNAQSRERAAFLGKLGDLGKAGNENDVLEGVFDTIKSQAKSLKGQVNNAYDLAREGGGLKINVDDIKDGLFSNVVQVRRQGQYDLTQMPQASARVKDLARLVRKSSGGRFTSANLGSMENWRTRVTNALASSTDKTEKRFLGEMLSAYDDFMYKTANEAVDSADEQAILAFRNAVSKRKEYGKLFESDKFVKDLVAGNKGIDDAVKDLIGTGSIAGKKRMESTYDAIIKAAGDEAGLVQKDLQTAFAKKLIGQASEGVEAGGEQAFISAAKMKKALEGLFVNNKKFAEKLYGKDTVDVARKAIDELEYISKTQSSTRNPSGSGEMVLRVLDRIPALNLFSMSARKAGESIKAGSARKSFNEFLLEPTQAQSRFFGAVATPPIAEDLQGAIRIDVRPDPNTENYPDTE